MMRPEIPGPDCGPSWAGRVGDDSWLVTQVDDELEVRTRDTLDPWASWSPPVHLLPMRTEGDA